MCGEEDEGQSKQRGRPQPSNPPDLQGKAGRITCTLLLGDRWGPAARPLHGAAGTSSPD